MLLYFFFSPFPVFIVIMTSRCFNFRFAYPLPLLPHLHTARMASGHPTDKFSFMYQPDTHKRYGARMHTHSYTHETQHTVSQGHTADDQVSRNNGCAPWRNTPYGTGSESGSVIRRLHSDHFTSVYYWPFLCSVLPWKPCWFSLLCHY